MTSGYYCAIFPFCGVGKKNDDKKTKAFYDWATTGIPVIKGKALGAYSDVMAKTEQQIVITKIILALGYG